MGREISHLQDHCDINLIALKLSDITGYVRYHFPSYNIAIIAFCDPFHRQDSWKHSLAIWRLPESFKRLRIKRDNKGKTVWLTDDSDSSRTEQIFIARALVKCTVHPLQASSGIYEVESATLVDYQDPCEKFKVAHNERTDATVEGSVYWQEIQPQNNGKQSLNKTSNGTSYGFVRLASGHERHFFLKAQKQVLGHLVKLKLFNNEAENHPNSCELV